MPSAFGLTNLITVESDFGSGNTFVIRERQTGGTLVQTVDTPGIIDIVYVARDNDGNLYSAELDSGNFCRVRKWLANGTGPSTLIDLTAELGGEIEPRIVGIDGNGNIYVADTNSAELHKFSSAGAFVQTYTPTDASSLADACVSQDGVHVYYLAFDPDPMIKDYNLNTQTLIGTIYTITNTNLSGGTATVRIHNSGDVLIYWDVPDTGAGDGETWLARVTNTGTIVDEWQLSGPDGYAATPTAWLLANTLYVANEDFSVPDTRVTSVDVSNGIPTALFNLTTAALIDIAHTFLNAFQGLERVTNANVLIWGKYDGF